MEQLTPGTGTGAINSEVVRTAVNNVVEYRTADGQRHFMYNGNPLETTTTTTVAGSSITTYVNYEDADFDQNKEDELWDS